MSEEKSLGQESGQRRLIDGRGVLVHDRPNLDHRFDQLMWRDDITQSQRWVQDLAHRAGVDDATDIIQALQTWEWGTGITKFRVMIVLENVGVALARKID